MSAGGAVGAGAAGAAAAGSATAGLAGGAAGGELHAPTRNKSSNSPRPGFPRRPAPRIASSPRAVRWPGNVGPTSSDRQSNLAAQQRSFASCWRQPGYSKPSEPAYWARYLARALRSQRRPQVPRGLAVDRERVAARLEHYAVLLSGRLQRHEPLLHVGEHARRVARQRIAPAAAARAADDRPRVGRDVVPGSVHAAPAGLGGQLQQLVRRIAGLPAPESERRPRVPPPPHPGPAPPHHNSHPPL